MMTVVVYDIASSEPGGAKRLRQVAKACANRSVPVQDSVYECQINAEEYRQLRTRLERIIDPEKDSVRFYLLGNRYQNRIQTLGVDRVRWDRETFVL